MTKEEKAHLLAKKFYEETGSPYSKCYVSAFDSLTLFEGITPENASKVSQEICNASLDSENWHILFKAYAYFTAGLMDYNTLIEKISGVLSF